SKRRRKIEQHKLLESTLSDLEKRYISSPGPVLFQELRLRAAVRWKTEPHRLLTEEEFQREAEEETRKTLEDPRKNCSSPEFRSWRTVARLQSPKRCP
ncbi:hypothetical protein KUCAC02_031846, partial [Chaenocephalus aceratus]